MAPLPGHPRLLEGNKTIFCRRKSDAEGVRGTYGSISGSGSGNKEGHGLFLENGGEYDGGGDVEGEVDNSVSDGDVDDSASNDNRVSDDFETDDLAACASGKPCFLLMTRRGCTS